MKRLIKLGLIVLATILTFNLSNNANVSKNDAKRINDDIQEAPKKSLKKELAKTNNYSISFNDDFDYIFKDYDDDNVHFSNSTLKDLSIENVTVFSTKDYLIESLNSNNSFYIDGQIKNEDEFIDLNSYYDFSKYSKFDIANWLYELNIINLSDKIDLFCSFVKDNMFDNIDCLDQIFNDLNEYVEYNNDIISDEASKLLGYDYDGSAEAMIDNGLTASYISTNFKISYNPEKTSQTNAKEVAEYYEHVKKFYENMEFRTPILESGCTRFNVGLLSSSGGSAAAATYFSSSSKTSASYILHFGFSRLNLDCKERIAHEYFHAIQNAYNTEQSWFKEACANWGKIIVTNSSSSCDWIVNNFINNDIEFGNDTNSYKYGQVLFPLTLHIKCGGYSAIRYLYEEYAKSNTTYSMSKFKGIVNNAIKKTGINESFDTIIRIAFSYAYDPALWYRSVNPTSYAWHNDRIKSLSLNTGGQQKSQSGTLNPLKSKYFKITLPENITGSVKVEFSFKNGNTWVQQYLSEYAGGKSIVYLGGDNTSFIVHNVGEKYDSIGFIITNVDLNNDTQYTFKYSLIGKNDTATYSSSTRLIEKQIYLNEGEKSELEITFSTSGTKIIQTLGALDTKIVVLDENKKALNSASECDDKGYERNAFVSIYLNANTKYYISTCFYNSNVSGYLKLLITNTFNFKDNASTNSSITSYEDIWNINSYDNYSLYAYCTQNYSNMVTYTPKSSGYHTIELISEFDNYLYVFDPTSSELGIMDVDYNDDGGEGTNAKLKKNLIAGRPYLIIFCQYNPSRTFDNLDTGDDVVIKISK